MRLIEGIFGPEIVWAFEDPRAAPTGLHPAEAAHVAKAVDKRRREFAAGRRAAHAVLHRLGCGDAAVPAHADRSPIWPAGIVGSISHCDTLCVAVAASAADGVVSLGVDLELDAELGDDLAETVLTADERAAFALLPAEERGRRGMAVFAIKECVYKALYPLTGRMLDFHDVVVDLSPGGTFAVKTVAGEPPNPVLTGRYRREGGHVLAGLALGR